MRIERSPSVRATVAVCCEFPHRRASSSAPTKKLGPAAGAAVTLQAAAITPASASVESRLRRGVTTTHHRQECGQVRGVAEPLEWVTRRPPGLLLGLRRCGRQPSWACTAVVLVLAASACGGGGSGRDEETGLNITFSIPGDFHIAHDISISKSSGANAVDQAADSIDEDNLVVIQRYNLNSEITAENLAKFKGEVDKVIGQLAGTSVSGHEVEYGGLPGYEYVIDVSKPAEGQSRLAVLFDGTVEYLVNCQSTPAERDRVEKGCRTVLDSIAHV